MAFEAFSISARSAAVSSTSAAPRQLGGPGDGDDPGLLRQQPGDRDLRRRRLLARGDLLEQVNQRLIRFHGLRREARKHGAEVVLFELGLLARRAGQDTLAERA